MSISLNRITAIILIIVAPVSISAVTIVQTSDNYLSSLGLAEFSVSIDGSKSVRIDQSSGAPGLNLQTSYIEQTESEGWKWIGQSSSSSDFVDMTSTGYGPSLTDSRESNQFYSGNIVSRTSLTYSDATLGPHASSVAPKPALVPEPSAIFIFAVGLIILGIGIRRQLGTERSS